MPRSISLFEAVLSSYAARTAPARQISSRRFRCSRRDAAYDERSLRNACGSAAPAASRCRSKSRRTARPTSSAPAGNRARTARRPSVATASTARPGRVFARVLRSCACRVADAGDGFAVRRAGERAAPLSRSLRAGDRPQSRRAGRTVRTGFARTQSAFGRGRAQRRMARRDRARGGSARRRRRRGAARLRAPARGPHRRRARQFLALSVGEARPSRRDRGHDRQRAGAQGGRQLPGEPARQSRPRFAPPAARSSARIFPIFWSGTGRNRRRRRPPRPASRRR